MKITKLGSSNIDITEVCLGTMTWGKQNTQEEAFEQLDYAINERGITFMDTAEMYAVPPAKETAGLTETCIGNWFAAHPSQREKLVLATKIVGPGLPWIREGGKIVAESIMPAIEGSLKRLQTDYIDLYQLHWPNRITPHFSRHWPGAIDPSETDLEKDREDKLGVLQALDDAVKAGKIRACGLSNETPWGIAEYAKLADQHGLPKMVSVQNEFSLLHLKDWPYVMETCINNNMAYLPWSPLAGGALTGKYADGQKPEGARWTMVQRNGIFRDTSYSHMAIAEYQKVAEQFDMSLAQMCLAWVYQCTGVTSTLVGATSMSQLKENIDAYDLTLSEDALTAIGSVIKKYPLPF